MANQPLLKAVKRATRGAHPHLPMVERLMVSLQPHLGRPRGFVLRCVWSGRELLEHGAKYLHHEQMTLTRVGLQCGVERALVQIRSVAV